MSKQLKEMDGFKIINGKYFPLKVKEGFPDCPKIMDNKAVDTCQNCYVNQFLGCHEVHKILAKELGIKIEEIK